MLLLWIIRISPILIKIPKKFLKMRRLVHLNFNLFSKCLWEYILKEKGSNFSTKGYRRHNHFMLHERVCLAFAKNLFKTLTVVYKRILFVDLSRAFVKFLLDSADYIQSSFIWWITKFHLLYCPFSFYSLALFPS